MAEMGLAPRSGEYLDATAGGGYRMGEIARSSERANAWLNEMAGELQTENRRKAYRVLRAYLHALRDLLPENEAIQLAAQLPKLIRGAYYEGWRRNATPVGIRDFAGLLRRVTHDAGLTDRAEAAFAVSAAGAVLRRHLPLGEIDEIRANLPEGLRPIL